MLYLRSCLFKPSSPFQKKQKKNKAPLIAWLAHAWPHTANNNNRAAAPDQTWWRSVMSQSHVITDGTSDEGFQEPCFLWERGASVAVSCHFDLFNFYVHKNLYKMQMEKKNTTLNFRALSTINGCF